MVTRAKPAEETKPEEPTEPEAKEGSASATIEDVKRIVTEAVQAVLGTGKDAEEGKTGAEADAGGKAADAPKNAREEESRMTELVDAAVQKILADKPPDPPGPTPPETPPIKVRRIESGLWGTRASA